jgi:phosphonate transport system substrate-binding protein
VDFDLVSTTDWAGMAVAMGSGQLDVAWMGPWGYVIANSATNCQAVATVKYDDKPIYYAIIIARPDLQVLPPPSSRHSTISKCRRIVSP